MWRKLFDPASWIDTQAPADGAPPNRLWAFVHWCLKGSYGVIGLGAATTIAAGVLEMITAALLGWIRRCGVDYRTRARSFTEQLGFMLAAVVFILLIRPAMFMLSAYVQSVAIGPALRSMILTRLHRWTLGHSTQFFENDFAGRIAQKEMQGRTGAHRCCS
jgi:ATP-binding cassette subfamily B protein